MGFFGFINALILLAGVIDRVEVGSSNLEAQWAGVDSEFVPEAVVEHIAMEDAKRSLARKFGWPWILTALLAAYGGVRLLRRETWSRLMLVVAGLAAITLSVVFALQMREIAFLPAQDIEVPADIEAAMRATVWVQVLLQSLPVLLGMSLLRHPIVSRFVDDDPRPS